MVGKPTARGAKGPKAKGSSAGRRRAPVGVTTEQLLERYRLRRSRKVLDEIVERHRATVEAMAMALSARLPRSVDAQDLLHAGMWGLMQAAIAFDSARGDSFDAFLRIRVRGAMLDELRHMDFLPRLFRRRVRERDAARSRLRLELEREPTNSELAAELGVTEDVLMRCPDASSVLRSVNTSQDDEPDGHLLAYLADDEAASPIEAVTQKELLELVRKSLDPVEWKVLKLHYLDGLTGRQVAQRMRLSASRICQIHVQVLERLKQHFTAAMV